jgi:hypothetical protein
MAPTKQQGPKENFLKKVQSFSDILYMDCIHEVKNQLFVPIANLTSVQKGIKYSDIKICNSLLSKILNLNSLNAKLNPICHLLALLAHPILHISRIRVKNDKKLFKN